MQYPRDGFPTLVKPRWVIREPAGEADETNEPAGEADENETTDLWVRGGSDRTVGSGFLPDL